MVNNEEGFQGPRHPSVKDVMELVRGPADKWLSQDWNKSVQNHQCETGPAVSARPRLVQVYAEEARAPPRPFLKDSGSFSAAGNADSFPEHLC